MIAESPAFRRREFVNCIEPWHGHADYEDFTGELKDKEGIIKLPVDEIFETEMSFIVNN